MPHNIWFPIHITNDVIIPTYDLSFSMIMMTVVTYCIGDPRISKLFCYMNSVPKELSRLVD